MRRSAGFADIWPRGADGLARSVGGLGPEAFLKPIELVRTARAAAVTALPRARVEGLHAHGEALAAR